ncbi:MAG TPA: putative 2OG-Fe(II) oxygenase [Sphingomicrobium sp.]|nr:putative 2OG-Fe(II) oxygenase [Sphingomicrobium sp.]HWJ58390.1 putative 2OG-Fe(II) oxygenase [Sphingomicrobium sp.]
MNIASTLDPARVLDSAIEALNRRDFDLPLADVDRALAMAPQDYRLWHIKGLMHREQEQRELAIPALRRAVDLAPDEPLVAHGYARTLLEAGLPSVPAFSRAMKLAPGNPEVVTGMVAALVADGRAAEAIEGLEQALDRSPLWTDGHLLLASLRWSEGEHEGFTRSFDRALALHPTSIDLRRFQLTSLLEAEQFDEALSHIEEGRQRYGEQLVFTSHEAVIRSETGEIEAADRLFAQIPELEHANFDVRRVRHWLRTGRPQQAAELLNHWLDSPEQEMFWPYAATAWRMTNDPRSEWLEGDERLVQIYDLADRLPPLGSLAETLRQLHKSRSQPLAQSVRGGTQTDGNLFQRIEPEIVALREQIRRTVAEHARSLPPLDPNHPLARKRPSKIRFSGAWSVRLAAGGCHANHVHPMGWLSSALYIVLPPDLGRDQAGWLTLGEPQAQLRLDVAPRRMIEPKPGRLALFPSWMWHGTRPFGEGERITVAFDVAPGP